MTFLGLLRFFVCLTILLAITPTIQAVVLLNDEFQENGVLNGKTPMPGPGANWNSGAQTGVNSVSVVDGEVLLLQTESTNGEDIANVFTDQGVAAATFAGFDFRLPSGTNAGLASDAEVIAEGVFFVTLRGTSASTTQRARTGFVPPAAGGDFRMAINADNGNLVAGAAFPTDLEFDTTYRAVISFNAQNASSQLWVDPTTALSTNVSHTGVAGSIGTVINRIILRQANSNNGTQLIDNVIVATTFEEALGIQAEPNGDFNGDGTVDAADYVVWRKTIGTPADYDLWKMTFGEIVGGGLSSGTAVPEPAAWLLAALVTAFVTGRRRIARSRA